MLDGPITELPPAQWGSTARVRRGGLAWGVVAVWLVTTAGSFWWFELRQQRSFESAHTALFDASVRAKSAEAWFRNSVAPHLRSAAPGVATVVHIYTADCACNRFTHPHLARIVAGYQHRGVSFVAAERQSTALAAATGVGPDGLQQVALRAGGELAWIEATPAALVFDAAGKLVYFGPYSDSARCGVAGGLVERVLDRMLAGQMPHPQPFYGGGCFCGGKTNI